MPTQSTRDRLTGTAHRTRVCRVDHKAVAQCRAPV